MFYHVLDYLVHCFWRSTEKEEEEEEEENNKCYWTLNTWLQQYILLHLQYMA